MGTNCEIKFDNNSNGTFISGQMLTGSVVLTLTEKKKFRGNFPKKKISSRIHYDVSSWLTHCV